MSFLRSYKTVTDRIEADLSRAFDLTLIEYSLLFGLAHQAEHRLRQVDLAKGVMISKSRVTRLMNSLVRKGYVRREKGVVDRRTTYTVLTEKGERVFESATPVFTEAFHRHFVSLIPRSDHGTIATAFKEIGDEEQIAKVGTA